MAGKTLTVYLAADAKKLRSGLTGAKRDLSSFDGSVGGLGSKLSGMLGPAMLTAAAAAGALAVKLGVDGVQAAIADEASADKLAKTLENLGAAHDVQHVEDYIDALSRSSGVADDVLRPAYDRLFRSVGNVTEADRLLALSLNVAAGSGKDVEAVTNALGKAYDGNTGALGKLGTGLDASILKTGDMNVITEALATTFGGQAATAASSYQGQLARLKVGADELSESFGRGFLSALGDTNGKTDDLMSTLKDLEPVLSAVGSKVGETVTAIAGIAGVIMDAKNALDGWYEDLGDNKRWVDPFLNSLSLMSGGIITVYNAILSAQSAWDELMGSPGPSTGGDPGQTGGAEWGVQKPGVKHPANAPASTAGDWASFYSGNQAAQEKLATATANQSKLWTDYSATLHQVVLDTGSSASATGTLTNKVDALGQAMLDKMNPQLETAIGALQSITTEANAYALSLKDAITGTVSLSDAWSKAADKAGDDLGATAKGAVEIWRQQISDARAFASSLAALAQDPQVSQALLNSLLEVGSSQGPVAGKALADEIINSGLGPTMSDEILGLDIFAGGVGESLKNTFYGQGIDMATSAVEGMAEKISKSQERLNKLGRAIGQPMGDAIRAEIEDAIAKASGAAATARREAAESARAADSAAALVFQGTGTGTATPAAAAPVTDQTVGTAISRIIYNTNARSGYSVPIFGGVLK